MNRTGLPKCVLVDWSGSDEYVAEGCIMSEDPQELVHGIPIGPNRVKVLVESAIKPQTFLWRPAGDMNTIEEAVGGIIAWPANYCIIADMRTISADTPPKVMFFLINDFVTYAHGLSSEYDDD